MAPMKSRAGGHGVKEMIRRVSALAVNNGVKGQEAFYSRSAEEIGKERHV
jgi:hypothetical protein